MKQITRTSLLSGAGLLALALSLPTYAAVSWDFTGGGQNINNGTLTGSNGSTEATIKGYSDTKNSDTQIDTVQTVNRWSGGLGVCNKDEGSCGSPSHSTDNVGDNDMILFSFNEAIDLDTVSVGWRQTDSDITVLAYTGAGVPATLVDESYSSLPNGWGLIGHYSNVYDKPLGTVNVNAGNVFASYWLIGAYNSLIGGNGWSTGNDQIKLSAISGSLDNRNPPGSVPEPTSLALMAIGLTAFGFKRRKKQA